jgi:hypothetical protein
MVWAERRAEEDDRRLTIARGSTGWVRAGIGLVAFGGDSPVAVSVAGGDDGP